MKKSLAIVLGCSLSFVAATAQADTLANWTFETSLPTTSGGHLAEAGLNAGTSQAYGSHASSSTVYSNPAGNGSLESFSSNFWAIGDYYRFTTNSVGFENISISFDQTSSNTGPRDFILEWGTDGVVYNTFATYQVAPISWSSGTGNPLSSYSFDLSSITALNDSPSVYFRLTVATDVSSNGTGTIATAGTNRVDNIVISGTAIPAPGALALLGLAGLVSRRRRA